MGQLIQIQMPRLLGTRYADQPVRLDVLAADIRNRRNRYLCQHEELPQANNLLELFNNVPLYRSQDVAPGQRIRVQQSNLLDLSVDALVSATNTELKGEGGLAAAISARGGPGIARDCQRIGWCDIGSAVATYAWDLPSQYVIHVPTFDRASWQLARLQDIGNGARAALNLARDLGVRSLGIPLLGSGIAGLPTRSIAIVLLATIKSFAQFDVTLCVDWPEDFAILANVMGS